jgi:hypothetical protein
LASDLQLYVMIKSVPSIRQKPVAKALGGPMLCGSAPFSEQAESRDNF